MLVAGDGGCEFPLSTPICRNSDRCRATEIRSSSDLCGREVRLPLSTLNRPSPLVVRAAAHAPERTLLMGGTLDQRYMLASGGRAPAACATAVEGKAPSR